MFLISPEAPQTRITNTSSRQAQSFNLKSLQVVFTDNVQKRKTAFSLFICHTCRDDLFISCWSFIDETRVDGSERGEAAAFRTQSFFSLFSSPVIVFYFAGDFLRTSLTDALKSVEAFLWIPASSQNETDPSQFPRKKTENFILHFQMFPHIINPTSTAVKCEFKCFLLGKNINKTLFIFLL